MKEDKIELHVAFASLFLLMLFVGLTLAVASIARANPTPDSAEASATFRTKCVMCHGPDGAGSPVGKSMNVPDLRSPEVQKLTDVQVAQIISDGKGGCLHSRVRSARVRYILSSRTFARFARKNSPNSLPVSPRENWVSSLRSNLWEQ
jgi:hypothetical protein